MKKYIILSDIHSNFEALKKLEYIEEVKDENSHIIFAGDYIDGEEQEFEYGLKVLDYIIELVEKKKATALLGNHTDNILVVHAGIDWRVNINEQDDYDLLWIRNPYIYPNLRIDINDIPKDNLKRIIVTGHTPTAYMTRESICNIISYEYPCKRYFIDGGSKMGRKKGHINVLVLDEFGNELNRYILK